MKNEDHYKSSIDPKHNTILPSLEIGKVIKKYESTRLRDVMDLNEYPRRNLHSQRQKETSVDRIDKIDHEILVYNDKLITALHIDPVEFDDIDNKGLKTENYNNTKVFVFDPKEILTPNNINFSKKKSKGLLSRSVNVSPLRMSTKSTLEKQQLSTTKCNNSNNKAGYYQKDNVKLKNISKFINKPKSSGKNTKATSRSNSLTNNTKSSNSVVINHSNCSSSKAKRPLISFPSLNARNNDKIIVDLQTMFGKKVENFEAMYPNLSETDKKNLISVLLSISFEFKNEIKEEKVKNDLLSKELLNKTRQLGILSKEIDSIKKIPNSQATIIKPQAVLNKKVAHGRGNSQFVLTNPSNVLTDTYYKITSPSRKKCK